MTDDNPFAFDTDESGGITIESAVFQALGAASACWENLSGAGVFESTRCKEIGDTLLEFIEGTVEQYIQHLVDNGEIVFVPKGLVLP